MVHSLKEKIKSDWREYAQMMRITSDGLIQNWWLKAITQLEQQARAEAIKAVMACRPDKVDEDGDSDAPSVDQDEIMGKQFGYNLALEQWSEKIKNLN